MTTKQQITTCDIIILSKTEDLLNNALTSIDKYADKSCIGKIIIGWTADYELPEKNINSFNFNIIVEKLDHYHFSENNNYLVNKYCSSEICLFMNDDVTLCSDAISSCLKMLEDKNFGAIGIKLLYPDQTIQHAGVFWACNNLGMCQGVGHIHFKEKNRAIPPYIVLGVTGAFLMMRVEDFKKIGGFDERFKHCFEDVVLCKRIRDLGMYIVCNNSVEAIHYESQTRKQAMCKEDSILLLSILNER